MLYSTDGLIIRETDVGEHDKILTLLTPSEGQISVSAKGARSSKSKLISATKLFTYGNYEIYKKGEFRYLREAAIIEPFFGLSKDIERMSLAAYFCEVACDVSVEGEPSIYILRMILNSLFALARGLYSLPIIKAVYELRTAGYSGFMPSLERCAHCGEEFPQKPRFDIMNGHLICQDCLNKLQQEKNRSYAGAFDDLTAEKSLYCPLSPSALAAMRYALTALPERMFSFEIKDDGELKLFGDACEAFLLNHLERDFRTLNFYKSLF